MVGTPDGPLGGAGAAPPWPGDPGAGAVAGLAKAIGAEPPPDWPPPLLDDAAARVLRSQLGSAAAEAGWGTWWIVLAQGAPTLVGLIGFHGPPDPFGEVELGYAVVASHHRRGIAPEALAALTAWALVQPGISRVAATTFPEHRPSVRVLERCGFVPAGPGPEPRTVRYIRPGRPAREPR